MILKFDRAGAHVHACVKVPDCTGIDYNIHKYCKRVFLFIARCYVVATFIVVVYTS